MLDHPLLATVALMKLEGHKNRQIADLLNVSVATVERKLQLIRHVWSGEVESS
jgi:DNA-directed RNA polymerase specialized sigma24 family protein